MTESEQEIMAAYRRLLLWWLDWVKTGENLEELIEQTKFITNYKE